MLDLDRDGVVTRTELEAALSSLKAAPSAEEIIELMNVLDSDKDHLISKEEIERLAELDEEVRVVDVLRGCDRTHVTFVRPARYDVDCFPLHNNIPIPHLFPQIDVTKGRKAKAANNKKKLDAAPKKE